MKRNTTIIGLACWLLFASVLVTSSQGADRKNIELERRSPVTEFQMRDHLQSLEHDRLDSERLPRALSLTKRHHFSSLQVKAMAETFGNDATRMDFAAAVFPFVSDPENFYEVYDAFQTLSTVMRLHDRVRQLPPLGMSGATGLIREVSRETMEDILRTIGSEGIESTKVTIAKQIIGARTNFSSRQIKAILMLFSIESMRLDMAKFSYKHVLDPENYFVVNEVFSISSMKTDLTRFLQQSQR